MRTKVAILAATVIVLLLAAAGLVTTMARRQPQYPEEWGESVHADALGDQPRLQGRWVADWPANSTGRKASVVIEGDKITFNNPLTLDPGFTESYGFVVNSEGAPKIIRLHTWLGPGHPLPGHQPPLAFWYSVDQSALKLWSGKASTPNSSVATYVRQVGP